MEEKDYTGKGIEGLEFDSGFIEISWDEWRTRFLPIPQPDTGDEFWDYGPPAWNDRLREQDPACFWTLISEGGLDFIHSGFRVVNRLGYYITTVPVPENVLIQVFDEPWSPEQVKEVLEVIRRCQRDTDCPEEIVDIPALWDWLDSHYPPDSWLYEICEWWELIYHYFGDVFEVED